MNIRSIHESNVNPKIPQRTSTASEYDYPYQSSFSAVAGLHADPNTGGQSLNVSGTYVDHEDHD